MRPPASNDPEEHLSLEHTDIDVPSVFDRPVRTIVRETVSFYLVLIFGTVVLASILWVTGWAVLRFHYGVPAGMSSDKYWYASVTLPRLVSPSGEHSLDVIVGSTDEDDEWSAIGAIMRWVSSWTGGDEVEVVEETLSPDSGKVIWLVRNYPLGYRSVVLHGFIGEEELPSHTDASVKHQWIDDQTCEFVFLDKDGERVTRKYSFK